MSSTSSVVLSSAPAALTLEALLYLVPMDATPESMNALDLSGRNISSLPLQIKVFGGIRKLLLANNALSSVRELGALSRLSHLNLSNNKISNLEGLASLQQLTVLQVSNNQLVSLRGIEGSSCCLKALIANDNKLSLASHNDGVANASVLAGLTSVETIVLSRNPLLEGYMPDITKEGGGREGEGGVSLDAAEPEKASQSTHPLDVFAGLPKLKKLSLSECVIPSLPNRWFLPMAVEVRLAQNQIAVFPEGVILRSVHTLDMSGNRVEELTSLRRCKYVQNLAVRGNPFTVVPPTCGSMDAQEKAAWWSDPKTHMILGRLFQQLRVLDGMPFVPLSKESYLAKKKDAEMGRRTVDENLSQGEITDRKRARGDVEETPDVVLEVPVDGPGASQSTVRGVVRKQRAVAEHAIGRNTKAVGAAAVEMLRKRQAQPSQGW